MCIGCKAIKYKKIMVDDNEFSKKLDCLQKIIYKTQVFNMNADMNFVFLSDINLCYKNKYDMYSTSHHRISVDFYSIKPIQFIEPLETIDSLISNDEPVILSTRFDLLPMYASYHISDKKELSNHFVLVIAADENYIYFIEDYYMLEQDFINHCEQNNMIYKMKKSELQLGINKYANILTLAINNSTCINLNYEKELFVFIEQIINIYGHSGNVDFSVGRECLVNMLDELKSNTDKMISNDFFCNHFTAHLMSSQRSILKDNIVNYVTSTNAVKDECIEYIKKSIDVLDIFKNTIFKDVVKQRDYGISINGGKYIAMIDDFITAEDRLFDTLKLLCDEQEKMMRFK